MATGITLSESDILKCPICLEVMKSPKSLPCLHSFCEMCIGEHIISAECKQNEKLSNYPCPVCRTVVTPTNLEEDTSKWAALLPSNSSLSSILEASQSKDDQMCNPCQRLDRVSKGTNWCRDCFEALCDSCKDFHCSIKTLANHKMTNIVNKETQDPHGIDISAISESCSVHKNKTIEAFCYDHKKVCCVLCLTLHHRKCDNVAAIEEIVETPDISSMKTIASDLQTAINEIYSQTEKEKQELELSVKAVEEKARKSVASVKNKLDSLLPCVLKNVSLRSDDELNKLDEKLGQLKKLLDVSAHISNVTSVVQSNGSAVQKFIHSENTKDHIGKNIIPFLYQFQERRNVSIELDIDSVVTKILELTDIGNIRLVESPTKEVKNLREIEENVTVNCSTVPNRISWKFNRSIRLQESSFSCGVCFSDEVVVCGNPKRYCTEAVEISTATKVTKCDCYYAKRIVIDGNKNIFVSFKDGVFQKLHFDRVQKRFICLGFNQNLGLIGGLATFEDDVYIVVENVIYRFRSETGIQSVSELTKCFEVRTDCSNQVLHALVIDPKRKHLIYTSKDKEIVSCTLDGEEVFCFKDTSKMPNPTSLAFHSSGLIFVGDETGSVHAISSEGHYIESVMSKCLNISRLCDLWFDENEKRLFFCGNEYIEIYDIS